MKRLWWLPLLCGSTSAVMAEQVRLPEVVVKPQISVDTEPTEMTEKTEQLLSVAGGMRDPLAALQSLAGVTSAGDSHNAPAVRGSAPEDNAYYVDMVPVYYLFHDFGNSIFNDNVIRSFDLYPAAFPSQYSNATGAVIDVGLRDPRHQKMTTTVDTGFIQSGVFVEGEVNAKQAFYVSVRRSLIDQFMDKKDAVEAGTGIAIDHIPVATDYQLKYQWLLPNQQKVDFSATGAGDTVAATFKANANEVLRDPDFSGAGRMERYFHSQALRWQQDQDDNHKLLMLSHSTDRQAVHYGTGQYVVVDGEHDILRGQEQWQWRPTHRLLVGADLERHDYQVSVNAKITPCSYFDPDCPTVDAQRFIFAKTLAFSKTNTYAEDQWQFNPQWRISTGLNVLQDDYLQQSSLQPRLHLHYQWQPAWALKGAVGRYSQLPQMEEMFPNIGNPKLRYMDANHYVLGLEHQQQQGWSWQVDSYYKKLQHVVVSIPDNRYGDYGQNYSNDAAGRAYGMELLINKKLTDKWSGWLALSVAKTEREDLRSGKTQPFDYDRPLVLNWVANYQYDSHWNLGLKWTVKSGNLYTPIVDVRKNANNSTVLEPVYGALNSERMPIYHRLDLRAEYISPTHYGTMSLYLDVINAYNQHNVDGYYFNPNHYKNVKKTPHGFGSQVPVGEDEGFGFFPALGAKITF